MTSTALPTTSAKQSFAEALDETLPVAEVIPVYGPPVFLLLVPWAFFGLLLAGPFAVLVTLVVALVAAWALVALIGAALASPFLLVRHLRGRWAHHVAMPATAPQRAAAPQLVPVESR